MLEAGGETKLRITETNSEGEEDNDAVHLRKELTRQEMLVKEAVQSCEQYKRINESLLQAMTQMTVEKNRGYEALLHREREMELMKQQKHMQDVQRMMNSKLDAAMSKAVSIENAKREVEEELQRVRADCLTKQQSIARLCHELEDLRLELYESKHKQEHFKSQPSTQVTSSMISSDSKSDELLTLNRRISEELEEKFQRILLQQTEAHNSEKKILEATIESTQFENKLLKKDLEHISKDLQKSKHELQECIRRNEQRLHQQDSKWRTLLDNHEAVAKKCEQKLTAKEGQLKQARKDNAALRVKLNKSTTFAEEHERKVVELEKLLAEAKLYIVQFDLENKCLTTKVKNQQKTMRKETQKLKEELIAVKEVELSRSRALEGLLSKASNTKPRTARSRHDSSHCSINLEKSILGKSGNQNDPTLCNLLESLYSRASSNTNTNEEHTKHFQAGIQSRRSSPQSRHSNITKTFR